MAKDYDNMAKSIFTDFAADISQYVIGTHYDVEVIENIDTEQNLVVEQRTDSTKRIRINGSEAILHIELQLRDSTYQPMWARNAAYHGIPYQKTPDTCLFQCHLFPSECWEK